MQVKKVMDGDDPVVVWGSGTQRRNYLHALDCADAMAALVEGGFTGAVNIGTEDTVTLRDLVDAICRIAGRRPAIVTDRQRPEGRRVKSSDATLLRTACPQFQPTVSLEQGLGHMIGWYRQTFGKTTARSK
jgi:nucleoside-diphosphate-sugar epimerase